MENKYNRHNRRKYSLKVHIVLVTKYRKKLLIGSIANDVKLMTLIISIFYLVTIRPIEFAILLKRLSKKQHSIYGTDSQLCYQEIIGKEDFWSDGYFAASIGEVSSATVKKVYRKSRLNKAPPTAQGQWVSA